MSATPKFYASGAIGTLSLTASLQTITTGQSSDSDIVVMSATNTDPSNIKTVTFADASGNTIATVQIPANAGQAAGSPPSVNLLNPIWGIVGIEPNPFGGYNFYLPASAIVQAKVNSISGGTVLIYWKRKDY